MLDLIIGSGILAILYFLIVRGFLYRGIIWIFGFVGLSDFLSAHIHASAHAPMSVFDHPVQWSIIISFFITAAAIITTKIKKETI